MTTIHWPSLSSEATTSHASRKMPGARPLVSLRKWSSRFLLRHWSGTKERSSSLGAVWVGSGVGSSQRAQDQAMRMVMAVEVRRERMAGRSHRMGESLVDAEDAGWSDEQSRFVGVAGRACALRLCAVGVL